MIVFLEVTPRWPIDATPVRVVSATMPRAQMWNGQRWAGALFDPGQLSVSLFSGDIGTVIESNASPVVVAEKALLEIFPDAVDVRWEAATYRMWCGDFQTGTPSPYMDYIARTDPYLSVGGDRIMISGDLLTMAMTIDPAPGLVVREVSRGKVERFEKDGGQIKLSLDPSGVAGDTKVLSREYLGTGGAEGGASLKGTLKPWIFGHAKNAKPELIDEDNSVYQFSGYGPIQSVDALYERGSSFGASIGDYANYAALVAANIPSGRWATCLAEGLIRLGAPQYGVITGDVKGDYAGGIQRRHPGAILQRVASERAISADAIDSASLAALDAFALTLPDDGYMNLVLTEQTTFLELARRLCAPYNAQAGFSLMGRLFACRIVIGTPTFTIDARGRRMPLVGSFVESDTPPPYKRIVMSGDISWFVHDQSADIAFYAEIKEVGPYSDTETYREGNIVSLPDGSRWLYVNPTPTAGNDPSDASAYWDRYGPGGVQTYVSETEPTAAGDGDLWFKESTGELRRWDMILQTWGGPALVDLTQNAQVTVVAPPTITLNRTWEGAVKSGQLPKTVRPVVTKGGVDIRTADNVDYSVTGTGGLSGKVTVDNTDGSASKGDVTLDNTITGGGSFVLSVSVAGVSIGTYTTLVQTADDSPPVNNGTSGGTDSTLATVTSTSYATMSGLDGDDPVMDVTLSGSGGIKLSANFQYQTTSASLAMICKGEYSSDGGSTWNDMNSGNGETTGSTSSRVTDPPEEIPGEMISNWTKTSLSAGTYKVRLRGKKASGATGSLVVLYGQATSSKT